MSDFDVKEKRFEQDIEEYLITEGVTDKAIHLPLTGSWLWIRAPLCRLLKQASRRSGNAI